ncbi:MAG: chitobiase/beta-hexosaminidase C-terminal domain-containing protein, partial [Muribaculaceae bacterium]|nr:chitobiase/beta-hexosaminidase C-terminal domain-containing protein [Muribaculaceae bacterium]
MKKLYRMAVLAAAMAGGASVASAQLVINELMQSNIDCIKDDLNEFPDSWVELYNAGDKTEVLSEYKLGDSDKLKKAYALPYMPIAPGEFVVIYCDKVGKGLHTSFRLDSGKGGSVYLFHNDEVTDKVEDWKKQPAPNIAYGKKSEDDDTWGYQAEPTPGAANCGTLCKDILGEPVFSVPGGVISDDVEVVLSLPEGTPEGAEIRYTLNGSEPTKKSYKYTVPFKLMATKVIRAKIFCDGYLSPRSTTHSYIKHPRELTLPLVSIVTDDKYFYSEKEGIYVQGNYSPGTPNYEYDWRRPINLEYFEEAGKESAINQLCETRVKGGATRGSALKSLAVYANKRFGTKRFNYEFFPDQTPGI